MPCRQCDNGKWRWGEGPCEYDSKEACERANEGKAEAMTIDLQPLADIPWLNLEQYVGLWLVDEIRFGTLFDQVKSLDLAQHVAANAGRDVAAASKRSKKSEDVTIQIIDIEGTMTKRGSSLSGRGSMIQLRRSIRDAANAGDVDAILLRIDSPGGTVAGTADLAEEVKQAAAKKPVWAFVEDVTASAAYWVASQANKIIANNATAEVGSIGTFMALYDVSGAAAMKGIKAVVIRSGRLKGAGFPGTELTEEQRQIWQEIVDKTQTEFTAGVAAGRKLPLARVESLAEGRMWLANDARQLGLIDGISSFDSVISDLAAQSRQRRKTMSEGNAPKPATWQELKNCCPGADADFLGKQMDAQATAEDATRAWMGELQRRSEAATKAKEEAEDAKAEAEKQAAEAKAEAEKAKAGKPGVEMLGGGNGKDGDDTGDPFVAWQSAVDEKLKTGLSKPDAIRALVKEQPELHAAYVEAHNAKVGPSSYRKRG